MSAEHGYDVKFRELQKYIPFIQNDIEKYKRISEQRGDDLHKKQKMEALLKIITNKKNKPTMETLLTCERVVLSLYSKKEFHLPNDNPILANTIEMPTSSRSVKHSSQSPEKNLQNKILKSKDIEDVQDLNEKILNEESKTQKEMNTEYDLSEHNYAKKSSEISDTSSPIQEAGNKEFKDVQEQNQNILRYERVQPVKVIMENEHSEGNSKNKKEATPQPTEISNKKSVEEANVIGEKQQFEKELVYAQEDDNIPSSSKALKNPTKNKCNELSYLNKDINITSIRENDILNVTDRQRNIVPTAINIPAVEIDKRQQTEKEFEDDNLASTTLPVNKKKRSELYYLNKDLNNSFIGKDVSNISGRKRKVIPTIKKRKQDNITGPRSKIVISTLKRRKQDFIKGPKSKKSKYIQPHKEAEDNLNGEHFTETVIKNTNIHWHNQSKYISWCMICDKCINVHQSVQHYNTYHRENYISRLPPSILQKFKQGQLCQPLFGVDRTPKQPLWFYRCPFCQNYLNTSISWWLSHFQNHTAEFRFECSKCHRGDNYKDKIRLHIGRQCKGARIKTNCIKLDEPTQIKAYVCHLCNFIQLKRRNLSRHYIEQHNLDRTTVNTLGYTIVLLDAKNMKPASDHEPMKKQTDAWSSIQTELKKKSIQPLFGVDRIDETPSWFYQCPFCLKYFNKFLIWWVEHFQKHITEFRVQCSKSKIGNSCSSILSKSGSSVYKGAILIQAHICHLCKSMHLKRDNLERHYKEQHSHHKKNEDLFETIILLNVENVEIVSKDQAAERENEAWKNIHAEEEDEKEKEDDQSKQVATQSDISLPSINKMLSPIIILQQQTSYNDKSVVGNEKKDEDMETSTNVIIDINSNMKFQYANEGLTQKTTNHTNKRKLDIKSCVKTKKSKIIHDNIDDVNLKSKLNNPECDDVITTKEVLQSKKCVSQKQTNDDVRLRKTTNTNQQWHIQSKYKKWCMICAKRIHESASASHYKKYHGENYISRFAPGYLEKFRLDQLNKPLFGVDLITRQPLWFYRCPFCLDYLQLTMSLWLAHLQNHTAEYRHECSECHKGSNKADTVRRHITSQCKRATVITSTVKLSSQTKIKGHVCHLCNFIQLQRVNLEKHYVEQHHLEEGSIELLGETITIFSTENIELVSEEKSGEKEAEIRKSIATDEQIIDFMEDDQHNEEEIAIENNEVQLSIKENISRSKKNPTVKDGISEILQNEQEEQASTVISVTSNEPSVIKNNNSKQEDEHTITINPSVTKNKSSNQSLRNDFWDSSYSFKTSTNPTDDNKLTGSAHNSKDRDEQTTNIIPGLTKSKAGNKKLTKDSTSSASFSNTKPTSSANDTKKKHRHKTQNEAAKGKATKDCISSTSFKAYTNITDTNKVTNSANNTKEGEEHIENITSSLRKSKDFTFSSSSSKASIQLSEKLTNNSKSRDEHKTKVMKEKSTVDFASTVKTGTNKLPSSFDSSKNYITNDTPSITKAKEKPTIDHIPPSSKTSAITLEDNKITSTNESSAIAMNKLNSNAHNSELGIGPIARKPDSPPIDKTKNSHGANVRHSETYIEIQQKINSCFPPETYTLTSSANNSKNRDDHTTKTRVVEEKSNADFPSFVKTGTNKLPSSSKTYTTNDKPSITKAKEKPTIDLIPSSSRTSAITLEDNKITSTNESSAIARNETAKDFVSSFKTSTRESDDNELNSTAHNSELGIGRVATKPNNPPIDKTKNPHGGNVTHSEAHIEIQPKINSCSSVFSSASSETCRKEQDYNASNNPKVNTDILNDIIEPMFKPHILKILEKVMSKPKLEDLKKLIESIPTNDKNQTAESNKKPEDAQEIPLPIEDVDDSENVDDNIPSTSTSRNIHKKKYLKSTKRKCSELDRLNKDIADMFICQDVRAIMDQPNRRVSKSNALQENNDDDEIELRLESHQSNNEVSEDSSSPSKPKIRNTNIHWHNQSKYVKYCKICAIELPTNIVASHYKANHGENYISRLSPEVLKNLRQGKISQPTVVSNGENKKSLQYSYKCPFCFKDRTTSMQLWLEHFRSHTAEYRYQCSKCHKGSNRSNAISKHIKSMCEDATIRKCNYIKNINANRSINTLPLIKAYICQYCNFIQLNRRNLKRHYIKQHEFDKTHVDSLELPDIILFNARNNEELEGSGKIEGNEMISDELEEQIETRKVSEIRSDEKTKDNYENEDEIFNELESPNITQDIEINSIEKSNELVEGVDENETLENSEINSNQDTNQLHGNNENYTQEHKGISSDGDTKDLQSLRMIPVNIQQAHNESPPMVCIPSENIKKETSCNTYTDFQHFSQNRNSNKQQATDIETIMDTSSINVDESQLVANVISNHEGEENLNIKQTNVSGYGQYHSLEENYTKTSTSLLRLCNNMAASEIIQENQTLNMAALKQTLVLDNNNKIDDVNPSYQISTQQISDTTTPHASSSPQKIADVSTKSFLKIPSYVLDFNRFICGYIDCNYDSVVEDVFRKHISTLHSSEKTFRCRFCKDVICKRSISVDRIVSHLRFHSSIIYRCGECNFIHYKHDVMKSHITKKHATLQVNIITHERLHEDNAEGTTITTPFKAKNSIAATDQNQ